MDFIESCRKFISYDSSQHGGTRDLVHYAATLCKELNLSVELQEETVGDHEEANIIIRTQKTRPAAEFLLQSHLDTPSPGPYRLWEKTGGNPFDAAIIDQHLYGLGAAGSKIDFLCKLQALSHYRDRTDWKLPPVLVGTYGEERGMIGMLKIIRKNKISPRMAIVSEPSHLEVLYAGKGYAAVEIKVPFNDFEKTYREEHNLTESTSTQSKVFIGKSSHSSQPQLGDNAITKMLEYINQLPDGIALMQIDGGESYNTVPSHAALELDIVAGSHDSVLKKIITIYQFTKTLENEFAKYTDLDFEPQHPTLNIGMVRTHDDHIVIGGSCRIPPSVSNEVYQKWMSDFQKVCLNNQSEFRILDYKRPYRTNENSILFRGCIQNLEKMGLPPHKSTHPSINEASLLTRIGVECVSFGAGVRESNVYTPNENVKIEDLYKAIEFYKHSIERFCL